MQVYTTEQLLELKPNAQAPKEFDIVTFTTMIAELKEKIEKKHTAEGENKFTFRRRSSRHESRPQFAKKNHRKHEQPKVDADGWVTYNKAGKKSVTNDDDSEARDDFKENHKAASLIKARPNTKRIGTRAAADSREAAAEVRNNTFNAFSALGSDDDDDDNDEDDEAIEEDEDEEEEEEK